MKHFYILFIFLTVYTTTFSQYYFNYFDGGDTLAPHSIIIDTTGGNIWQIGRPQKVIFDSAATLPGALVTDTLNNYPVNDSSEVVIISRLYSGYSNILAIQWMQKLDLDSANDRGVLEFSVDYGTSWLNAFNSPYVYNFYGFDGRNVDTLPNGDGAFTGTDSTWRNVWLCFDMSFLSQYCDSVFCRYRLESDSIETNQEGWMIDNLSTNVTLVHTVGENQLSEYMKVYPTQTKGRLFIETQKQDGFHIIESIRVIDMNGKLCKSYGISPTKFYIDIDDLKPGQYFVNIKTNMKSLSFPVILAGG